MDPSICNLVVCLTTICSKIDTIVATNGWYVGSSIDEYVIGSLCSYRNEFTHLDIENIVFGLTGTHIDRSNEYIISAQDDIHIVLKYSEGCIWLCLIDRQRSRSYTERDAVGKYLSHVIPDIFRVNIQEAASNLLFICHKINDIVDTDGWSITYSLDETTSMCAIKTDRIKYTEEEISAIFDELNIQKEYRDAVYIPLSSYDRYNIVLFYDESEIILFLEYTDHYLWGFAPYYNPIREPLEQAVSDDLSDL